MGVHRPDGSLVWISVNALALVSEGESEPHGALSTFRDITAQLAAEAKLRRREADLERLLGERDRNLALVRRSLASAVRVISELVDIRDPYTGGHQRRVSELATRIAQEMKLTAAQVEEIRVAALIHDVGKIAVPAEILSKPGRLSAPEFSLIKDHAEAGYRIISSAEMAGDTAEIVYQHHERCDGSGYPRGLPGDALILGAKVLMVADVVEAMTSHRPYRAALGLDAAIEEIGGGAGTRYDAEVRRACIVVLREQGFAFSEY
jgi:putative nucleotidyltransferase with HDIG domain